MVVAVLEGKREVVVALLEGGCPVLNAHDNLGATPLHIAADLDDQGVIAGLLVDAGADPLRLDREGKTAADVANMRVMLQRWQRASDMRMSMAGEGKGGTAAMQENDGISLSKEALRARGAAPPSAEVVDEAHSVALQWHRRATTRDADDAPPLRYPSPHVHFYRGVHFR